ncbi:uncharacterized protein PGTG_11811 [Puccinia graminis f. sp. tritici CRL 75-36-700-3]|uniref:DUF6589 domain-containing protein n=1 Tax=Puccinia graminis f. sp. tritici (strain CRL 75-36-700-3 / race SCCL) TaxID=418459 RepID=E3KMD0_PUCGT|nr:uncharacterized protein PGTG_11811 [Puccinia graminis f. sp. tritici CRL 75-36-700-3]EFP85455.2 hypothetical protein PGTG_11811 [Puccinia graminis f. sp. tritici CRL 75-36-700-3]
MRSLPTVMTPKEFMLHFIQSPNSDIAYLRRFWRQPKGIETTMDLVRSIHQELAKSSTGREAWDSFIQEEAVRIGLTQAPPRGNYPMGCFHSSTAVGKGFFTADEMALHERDLTERDMPFLYELVLQMLNRRGQINPDEEEEEPVVGNDHGGSDVNVQLDDIIGVSYELQRSAEARFNHRSRRIAVTICAMVAFGQNRRHNAFQLNNAVRFYACGVSDRVHEYLNYLGLLSSRKTAISALKSLARESATDFRRAMTIQNGIIAPTMCIDNIDIEQRIHQQAIGNQTKTFRGTWGYIHLPDRKLLENLDASELDLTTFKSALNKVDSIVIEPHMFLPTPNEEQHEVKVWKSQIAWVLQKYIALPADKASAMSTDPPVIEQISHEAPNLLMMKLMEASDNSAEGVGQVFQSLINQSGLDVEEFFTRLQPMDGDLATVQNFNCLRSQRGPSKGPHNALDNIFFQLGASHTLWNVGSTIFSHHFGDASDSTNCGAWQHLEALGFPSEKAIQKKDFTLMINQIERVFEANIYYCLRVIMQENCKKPSEERMTIPTDRWNSIINECYDRFCSPLSRSTAAAMDCPKLSNNLIQLHDFSTVVEAKRSMKAGDVGRLILIWKKWSLMAQALTGLTNYSSYLPRMVLLLTVFLPDSLSKYLRHNLLISPSGRPGHFVAKDFWLEIQNYWIKFLYNHSGTGTQIDRLRDVFSPNIFLLQRMFQSLKHDCGARPVHQTHRNDLPFRSLVMFSIMGNNRDILAQYSNAAKKRITKVLNTYIMGIKKMRTTICTSDIDLKKFKKNLTTQTGTTNERGDNSCSSDDDEPQSSDM